MATEKEKGRINVNKPIYIGTSILDLSKILMQYFHYNYIKNKYGNKPKMLLTDTYSLKYKIETENVNDDLYKDKELFGFNNYPKDSKYYNAANKIYG